MVMSEQQLQTSEMIASDQADETTSKAPSSTRPSRPAGVPEKFWDADAGSLRTEALLKSYVELERKLGSMVALPQDEHDEEGQKRLLRLLGVPETPDDYRIESASELISPAPEINARLHDAGFTAKQAQLVYDLAAEHLAPLIEEAVSDVQVSRDVERLTSHFGGEEAWQMLARQIKTWGRANLSDDAFETLASSYEGVLAMHQMMQAREPAVLRDGEGSMGHANHATLSTMMRDPRYWRDRDPAFIAEVTEGFKRLYAG
jgi:hypothetical protein